MFLFSLLWLALPLLFSVFLFWKFYFPLSFPLSKFFQFLEWLPFVLQILFSHKTKIKRLSLSIETLNRGSTLIYPLQDTHKPISRQTGTIYYCMLPVETHSTNNRQIQPFNSRAHFIPIPVRLACSHWQPLSDTFHRITLPVLRLCYIIFSTPVLYAI